MWVSDGCHGSFICLGERRMLRRLQCGFNVTDLSNVYCSCDGTELPSAHRTIASLAAARHSSAHSSDDKSRAILFLSYKQISDICIQSILFQRSTRLRNYTVILHNNQLNPSADLLGYAKAFPNERTSVIWTTINGGYSRGPITQLAQSLPLLQSEGCQCALHLHPDVFVMNETRLLRLMDTFCAEHNRDNWLLARFFGTYNAAPAFDAFMFKPLRLPPDAFDGWAKRTDAGTIPEKALENVARENTGYAKADNDSNIVLSQYAGRYKRNHQLNEMVQWEKTLSRWNGLLFDAMKELNPDGWGLMHIHNARHDACPDPAAREYDAYGHHNKSRNGS